MNSKLSQSSFQHRSRTFKPKLIANGKFLGKMQVQQVQENMAKSQRPAEVYEAKIAIHDNIHHCTRNLRNTICKIQCIAKFRSCIQQCPPELNNRRQIFKSNQNTIVALITNSINIRSSASKQGVNAGVAINHSRNTN